MPLLRRLSFDGVVDVGANRGQFSLACQLVKPGMPICAFEPIPEEARVFRKVHGGFSSISLTECALGDEAGTATLHLSQSADSSSLLPIGTRQTEIFPSTPEVGVISVPVRRLDDCKSLLPAGSALLLKIDVQGFELQVLRGAIETLKSCQFVYVECSEIPLYEGQALRPDVARFLVERGFAEPDRFNEQYDSGQLIQADYLFVRNGG